MCDTLFRYNCGTTTTTTNNHQEHQTGGGAGCWIYKIVSTRTSTMEMSATSGSTPLQNSVLLKSVFYLNNSRSKSIVVGLHMGLGLSAKIQILPPTGEGVTFTFAEWEELVAKVKYFMETVFNDVFLQLPSDIHIGDIVLFFTKHHGNTVIGIRSALCKNFGVYLSEVSCKNLVHYSRSVAYTVLGLNSVSDGIWKWYGEFLDRVKSKYEVECIKYDNGESKQIVKLDLLQYVTKYVDNLTYEEKFICENLEKLVYELGPQFIADRIDFFYY